MAAREHEAAELSRKVAAPIRPAYQAMTHDALLASLEQISGRVGGTLQIACRNLYVIEAARSQSTEL